MTARMMAVLCNVIAQNIAKFFRDNELNPESGIKDFFNLASKPPRRRLAALMSAVTERPDAITGRS